MSMTIGQPGMNPAAAQPPAMDKKPVEQAPQEQKTDFQEHLNQQQNVQNTQQAHNVQQVQAPGELDKVRGTDLQSTQRPTAADKARSGDLFNRMDAVRAEFETFMKKSADMDAQIASGKIKADDPKVMALRREEMRMLLHFQTEMQGAAIQVEIASKVVEHGTSGVKTVLQTQA